MYYGVLYQGCIHTVLMSVLRKKGETDRDVIVIVAGGLGGEGGVLLQQAGFPIVGALPSHQIFFPPPESIVT